MENIKVHFIYLHPEINDTNLKSFYNFIHPGARDNDKQIVIIGRNLDISHHTFIQVDAKNWNKKKTQLIYLPYNLVESIREIVSHKSSLGFINENSSIKNIETEE